MDWHSGGGFGRNGPRALQRISDLQKLLASVTLSPRLTGQCPVMSRPTGVEIDRGGRDWHKENASVATRRSRNFVGAANYVLLLPSQQWLWTHRLLLLYADARGTGMYGIMYNMLYNKPETTEWCPSGRLSSERDEGDGSNGTTRLKWSNNKHGEKDAGDSNLAAAERPDPRVISQCGSRLSARSRIGALAIRVCLGQARSGNSAVGHCVRGGASIGGAGVNRPVGKSRCTDFRC